MTRPALSAPIGLALLGLALVTTGCGGSTATSTATDSTTPVAAGRGQRPRSSVRVITQARGATRAVRYTLEPGARSEMAMTMDMAMRMTINGQESPLIHTPRMIMRMTLGPVRVDPNGDFDVAYSFAGTELEGTGDLPPDAVETLGRELAALRGLAGRYVVTSRGEVLTNSIDIPDGVSTAVRQQLEQMTSAIDDLAMVWPEEPIGVGSVFEVERLVTTSSLTVRQRRRVRVTSMDDASVGVAITLTQTGDPQDLPSPPDQPSTRVHLDGLTGHGEGESVVSLHDLATTSTASAEIATDNTVHAGDQTATMHIEMSMTIGIGRAR